MSGEDYGDEVGSVEEIDAGFEVKDAVSGPKPQMFRGSVFGRNGDVTLALSIEGCFEVDRILVLDGFEFAAELSVAHRDADEDREEQEAREEDDRVELVVPLEVHEDQRDDRRFDRGDEKRNDQVARVSEVDVAGPHGDDRENEQRAPGGQVKAHGQDVRMMLVVIMCVFCVRSAHVASPIQPTR